MSHSALASDLWRTSGASLLQAGWTRDRQVGSHVILVKPGHAAVLSVPLYREVALGKLRVLIRVSGMSVQQFQEIL